MARIIQKRTKRTQKLAYILKPFVVYMLVKTAAMLALAILIPSLPVTGIAAWVEHNAPQLSAVVNAAASMAGAAFLLKDVLIEVSTTGEVDIDKNVCRQFGSFMRHGFWGKRTTGNAASLILCALLGITASFALNILVELTMLRSEKYDTVAEIQYSVPIWLGILLYGIISPMVEEMVFRGVIFNRARKFFGVAKAAVFSALLFGVFHGNLLQFLYGTAMGMLMAVCYEYCGCFAAPVLVHMSANVFVFLMSGQTGTAFFVTPFWCVVFMALSVAVMAGIRKGKDVGK